MNTPGRKPRSLLPSDQGPMPEERTDEVTGVDATMDEAEMGDAGNGVDPYGGDLSGGPPKPLEDESNAGDIRPDDVRQILRRKMARKEPEITAQSNDAVPVAGWELPE